MAFTDNFEAFKEAAAGVAQNAAQKTRLLATIAKDNLAILSEEDKIKKAQTELGKLCGVSRQTISLIERGDYSPSVTLALKIAKVCQASVEDIFSYEEETNE